MSTATEIVDNLIGEAIDNEDIFRDITDFLEQDRIDKVLQKMGNISLSFGFAIGTGDSGMIESNLREDGIDPDTLNWRVLSVSFEKLETNMVNIIGRNGIRCRAEGHDGCGYLSGTAWLDTMSDHNSDTPNRIGMDLIKDMLDSDEPLTTSSGSIMTLKTSDLMYKDVDPIIARAAEVSFSIFSTGKLQRLFDGLESGENAESLQRAVTVTEERFLAPRDPPGIFRKVINRVEIFTARCPGCKRLHGNFRTYDQAAGNRQCKHCTRDYVEKMTKVRTTGNFKHILKKKHEQGLTRGT